MKRKLATIILCSSLLLSACGNTTDTSADATPDTQATTNTTEADAPASSETQENTEKEEPSPLQILIDKYGSCYSSDNKPTIGQLYAFSYKDTVASVEDICSSTSGTYVLVHFEDSRKDTIVIDESRTSEQEYSEISEILNNAKAQINFPEDGGVTLKDVAPQPGDKDTFRKELIVSEIQDAGVETDETSYYVIKSDNGMESLIGVFKYQYVGYIPMVGEIMDFPVEDTVTSLGDSMLFSTWGLYTPIYFENSYNNMVVFEKSSRGATEGGIESEWEDIQSKFAEFNQYGEHNLDQLPQPGEQVSLQKTCEITAVTLDKENEKGTRFYTVEGAGGIQAQIMVLKNNIASNDVWEYGTLIDGIYQTPEFGMKIDVAGAEFYNFYNRGTDQLYLDITDNEFFHLRQTTLNGWKNDEHFTIELKGFFFEQDLTEDTALEFLDAYYNSTGTANDVARVEDTVIAGQTYYTVSYKNHAEKEVREWYQFEGNKLSLLSVSSSTYSDNTVILSWMSEL